MIDLHPRKCTRRRREPCSAGRLVLLTHVTHREDDVGSVGSLFGNENETKLWVSSLNHRMTRRRERALTMRLAAATSIVHTRERTECQRKLGRKRGKRSVLGKNSFPFRFMGESLHQALNAVMIPNAPPAV